jgi:hypothetical protein
MGLYRTKPEEVEAIQYTGVASAPFASEVPQWVWTAMGSGNLRFTSHGLEIIYAGMTENVLPGDWMVMHNDDIIRVCGDKVFKTFYVRARKRLYGVEEAAATEQGE